MPYADVVSYLAAHAHKGLHDHIALIMDVVQGFADLFPGNAAARERRPPVGFSEVHMRVLKAAELLIEMCIA